MNFTIAEKQLRSIFTTKRISPSILEPPHALNEIWRYRNYFRPKETKLVVLAESHALTKGLPVIPLVPPSSLSFIPSNYWGDYVKFFYCLGYGEEPVLYPSLPRSGTPHYWKFMREVVNCQTPILVGQKSNSVGRIKNKWELLSCLRCSGVWLLDASFFALNDSIMPNGDKQFILSSHIPHILGILKFLENPSVLMVGKSVQNIYEGLLPLIGINQFESVSQPNARGMNFSEMSDVIQKFTKRIGFESCCGKSGIEESWDIPEELEWKL